jgi:hypothetical protein
MDDRESIALIVRVKLPPGMTTEEVCTEIQRAIGFGAPTVHLLYVLPDNPDTGA